MAGGTETVPSNDSSNEPWSQRKGFGLKNTSRQVRGEVCLDRADGYRAGKSGRGGTEHEAVKRLDRIQRVQIPHGQSEQAGR
jgi:hypothetical protein